MGIKKPNKLEISKIKDLNITEQGSKKTKQTRKLTYNASQATDPYFDFMYSSSFSHACQKLPITKTITITTTKDVKTNYIDVMKSKQGSVA